MPGLTLEEANTSAASKDRTASMAPIGSTRIPSHFRIVDTLESSLACLSRAIITVGPVTIKSAPITSDVVIDSPARK